MKTVTVPVEVLRRAAANRRPGYMEACLAGGMLSADGKSVVFTREIFIDIRQKFNPRAGVAILKPGCC